MITPKQVKITVESFLSDALKETHPHTLDALLCNAKLPEWYENIAKELTIQQIKAGIESQSFDPVSAIRKWAAGYVEHTMASVDKHKSCTL